MPARPNSLYRIFALSDLCQNGELRATGKKLVTVKVSQFESRFLSVKRFPHETVLIRAGYVLKHVLKRTKRTCFKTKNKKQDFSTFLSNVHLILFPCFEEFL